MQEHGKRKARGALAALRFAWANRADPQELFIPRSMAHLNPLPHPLRRFLPGLS